MTAPFRHIFPVRACIGSGDNHAFTRDRMAVVWDALVVENKERWLFYDGQVRDRVDYISFMTDPSVFAYAVYDHDWETPLATYFVNNFMGNAAMMHFCYLDAGINRKQAIGIEATNFLLWGGKISALIGITPKPFRHAWKFALSVGFVKVGVIPGACRLATPGGASRLTDAVATLCTPETILPFPSE